jgi:hypothetical protein
VELLYRNSQLARPFVPISGTKDRATYLAFRDIYREPVYESMSMRAPI